MSYKAVCWAIQHRDLRPVTKLVLIQLADCHNAATGCCKPSISDLAGLCQVSLSTLDLHLAKLKEQGLIRYQGRTSSGDRVFYNLECHL